MKSIGRDAQTEELIDWLTGQQAQRDEALRPQRYKLMTSEMTPSCVQEYMAPDFGSAEKLQSLAIDIVTAATRECRGATSTTEYKILALRGDAQLAKRNLLVEARLDGSVPLLSESKSSTQMVGKLLERSFSHVERIVTMMETMSRSRVEGLMEENRDLRAHALAVTLRERELIQIDREGRVFERRAMNQLATEEAWDKVKQSLGETGVAKLVEVLPQLLEVAKEHFRGGKKEGTPAPQQAPIDMELLVKGLVTALDAEEDGKVEDGKEDD